MIATLVWCCRGGFIFYLGFEIPNLRKLLERRCRRREEEKTIDSMLCAKCQVYIECHQMNIGFWCVAETKTNPRVPSMDWITCGKT